MNAPVSTAEPASPVKRLCSALDAVKTAGSFAAFGRIAPDNIKPITVHDVGSIAFPLRRATVKQLIEKARQAPYGRGSETFVDTAVRNTWELDAAQLNLSSQWGSTVQSACKWVAKELGIAVPVSAELYKMLIYEKGAMFKAHTDTEKIPGMFGTLVICLPSEHQGGDLVIKHRNVTKVFQTSISQPSMACWFSDVTHEVLPLISGVRCVLTYNLAIPVSHQDHAQRPSAALNTPGRASIQEALSAWLESRNGNGRRGDGADYLYYLLDHAYTEANLSLHGLKGADRDRMSAMVSTSPCCLVCWRRSNLATVTTSMSTLTATGVEAGAVAVAVAAEMKIGIRSSTQVIPQYPSRSWSPLTEAPCAGT